MIQKHWSFSLYLSSYLFSNQVRLIPKIINFLTNLFVRSLTNIKAFNSRIIQCLYCLANIYCETINVLLLIHNDTEIKLAIWSLTTSVSRSRGLFIQTIREVSCSLAGQVSANSLCNNIWATADGGIWIKHIDFALVSLLPPPFPWHVC